MSYPQGYLYQPPGSLALYSCPAYGASALAAPRNEDLARSSSGSAFSPYPGSAAFSASAAAGFSSPLSYSTDPTTGFPSYMVKTSHIFMFLFCMMIRLPKQCECVVRVKVCKCVKMFLAPGSQCFCYESLISLHNFLIECLLVAICLYISSGLLVGFLLLQSLTSSF